jgi:hypothetical protein
MRAETRTSLVPGTHDNYSSQLLPLLTTICPMSHLERGFNGFAVSGGRWLNQLHLGYTDGPNWKDDRVGLAGKYPSLCDSRHAEYVSLFSG